MSSAIEGDKGLVAKTKAAHHAISAAFDKVLDPAGKTLVVQYEVKFQKGGNCGGGYLKLLEEGYASEGQDYNDKTPWVIMFGPDLTCPGTKVNLSQYDFLGATFWGAVEADILFLCLFFFD